MNKKVLVGILAGAMSAALSLTAMADLRLVNGKIEVDAQLKDLAAAYEEETGVHVEIESMGGGIDIQGTLKGYYQGDNMPDIFVNGGDTDFANWEGLLADMSDQEWVKDTDAAYVDADGKVLGFPYTTEAIGIAYNADILEKAGVDPATLTTPAAIKEAFETIDAQKEDLGLTAVIGYCAEATNLYWSTGNHVFGQYEDAGLARDDSTYFDLLSDGGQLDEERYTHFAELIDLFNQYSDPALLVSGTYDQQILNFASGKYAFVTQGSWIGATMTSDDADAYAEAGNFKVGFAPYAFEDGIDTIIAGPPSYWVAYADGNVDGAKDFFNWCAGDSAQQILVEDAGLVSPFDDCQYEATNPFYKSMKSYIDAGKFSGWHTMLKKDGLQNVTCQVFADYAQGKLDADSFVSTMAQVCQTYYAEN